MIYLYDDEAKKRIELKEIVGIDKDSDLLLIQLNCMVDNDVIKRMEDIFGKKTGKKCIVLPMIVSKVMGIK